jgi:hypothetical protein
MIWTTKTFLIYFNSQSLHLQSALRQNAMLLKFIVRASMHSRRLVSSEPHCVKYFRTSVACIVPTIPATAPKMPASLLLGMLPASGSLPKRHL